MDTLQKRDYFILYEVFLHRFLRVDHLNSLYLHGHLDGSRPRDPNIFSVEANNSVMARSCARLAVPVYRTSSYLMKPRAVEPYLRLGGVRTVYGLGREGARALERKLPELGRISNRDWSEAPSKTGRFHSIDHTCGVATVMVALRIACEEKGLKLTYPGYMNREQYSFAVPGRRRRRRPDAYFEIRQPDGAELFYFLEFSRTNEKKPRDMAERYDDYFQYWLAEKTAGSFRKRNRLRVLTVSEEARHLDALRRAARPVGRGDDYPNTWRGFLFADLSVFDLQHPERCLKHVYRYADVDQPVSLID